MLIDRKIVGGALLGVTLAVGTIVGATALSQNDETAMASSQIAGSRTLLTGADALALGCRPDEAAVIQHLTFQGERGLNSQCVVVSAPWAAAAMAPAVVASPAAAPAPALTAARSSAAPTVRRQRQIEASGSGRTWKKTALVIGGSTAAGAGIGGLIGGGKGALIGSAIGGGGSTIYEAMKRR
jgi:hypothetical protein